jgi:hypothetical protein
MFLSGLVLFDGYYDINKFYKFFLQKEFPEDDKDLL